ncbi:polynucleotidyl transferase, ribonuclease H-like superfamily protein isoform X2 [Carex rostrata]
MLLHLSSSYLFPSFHLSFFPFHLSPFLSLQIPNKKQKPSMGCGLDETSNMTEFEGPFSKNQSLCLHSFADLSHVSPAAFMYLLKECYIYGESREAKDNVPYSGTQKATPKFRILQQQVARALHNGPQPGPFTFVAECMYIIPLMGPTYAEGFSHMLLSSLRHFKPLESTRADFSNSKRVAACLLFDILSGNVVHEERIIRKIMEAYELDFNDVSFGGDPEDAQGQIGKFIGNFIESGSFLTAVTLIERFKVRVVDESLLEKLIENSEYQAAEKLAAFMGRPTVCSLIRKYLALNMVKKAYELVKRHDLRDEFPFVSRAYKESVLKKFAEKGCWDLAEMRAQQDDKLLEYLVYLALEAGYIEKVDELCERYSLEGYVNSLAPEEITLGEDFLDRNKLSLEEIVWVDEMEGLLEATEYIEGCKIVGIDSEWKPNYEKGSKPSKVSIIQIASEKRAFIFDLIKLYEEEPLMLDSCFRRILCSSHILKLGYNLQCDLHQLSHSYGDLECFRSYEMLLDIQKLFKQTPGGLAGLSKKVLGAGLNKTRRNSNWEQRPLSLQQKEYAALDAAVLVHIFHHVRGQPHFVSTEGCKVEWKSHIVSRMSNTKNAE